jgi:metallo-beta-lactamase family protein
LYTLQDSARTTGLLTPIEYDTPVVVAPGVTALFTDAGHVPGSAVIHLRIEQYGHRYSLTYTGDLGRPGFGVLPPPAPLPPAGLVLCESTYGGRQHPDPSTTEAALADAVSRAATAGGKLIIPAFGFGRTQIIVHFLLKAMREGAAPNLPIFVDSPLASQVAAVFRRHPEAFAVDLPGDQAAVRYVTSMEESASLPDRPGSAIIIAAGGMGDGGRVAGHLMKTVSDPANVIALVSFQAPRSLGRQLLERPEFITLFGKDRPLRAEVRHLEGYSSHADHDDLISQLKPLIARQPMVRFVHGEPTAAGALADDLRAAGLRDIAIPAVGEVMELLPDAD